LSRRDVVKSAAGLASTAALGGLAACASPPVANNQPWQLPAARLGPDASFEYIIVGSGAGGGPLAANLARAGKKVLVIEAGSADAGGLRCEVPVFHAQSTEDPSMQWDYFVRHWQNPPAQDSKFSAAGGGIWYPRAGTLGGCTAHNAMITVVPDDPDWDGIAAELGDPSWASPRMRSYFERLERCTYRPAWKESVVNESGHGYSGWLPTSEADPLLALRDEKLIDIVRAAGEQIGVKGVARDILLSRFDPNDKRIAASKGGRDGLFFTPMAVGDGKRFGTRDYLLATARTHPENLTILTHALVTRILFDGRRAVGVEYLAEPSLYRADPRAAKSGSDWASLQPRLARVAARREVILSAGAFNTPQLLMLSGIGAPDALATFGITPVAARPGVGRNLQDRYEVTVVNRFDSEFALLRGCALRPPQPGDPPDPCFSEWQNSGAGMYATNGVVIGVVQRSRPQRRLPDLYIFGVPGAFHGYYPGYSQDATKRDRFAWAILKGHTQNRGGEVKLRSADPRDTPDINFHYFEEGTPGAGEDLDSVVAGVQLARSINKRLKFHAVEEVPGPDVRTPQQIADYIRREAWGHHASCSAKMGPASDPMAVVDGNFRVHGVDGLRVVDASIFPRIPGLFIVTAVYMVSEKATDVILAS
jgi:choline dehydrogenase